MKGVGRVGNDRRKVSAKMIGLGEHAVVVCEMDMAYQQYSVLCKRKVNHCTSRTGCAAVAHSH